MYDGLTYDSFNFSDYDIILTNVDYMRLPGRDNQLESLAGENGAVLVQSTLGGKTIVIEGYYIGDSIADAQAMYDTLASVFNRQDRTLIIPHANSTRKFIATPENIAITQPKGLNRIIFSVEFVVPKSYAEAEAETSLIDTTVTIPAESISFNIVGTAKTRPLINFDFTTVTGGTAKTVSIRNANDLIGLDITRDFVSGDVIIVDTANFQLYINGTLTEPNGRFPSWQAGSGALYYSDTFSTRSVDITATYKQRNI